jgi:hypothetical protein
MAVASLPLVPLIGVVDGKGAAAIEVGELLARQAGGDVIDADRRLLVALAKLFRPELALRDVVIGDESRRSAVVLVEVEARLLGIDHTACFCSGCICRR